MSSRIVRRSEPEGEDAQPIQWRTYGESAAPRAMAHSSARKDAPSEPDQVKQMCAAAYQQGHAAGEAGGAQRAQSKLDPAIASFSSIVNELSSTRIKLRAEA